MIQISGTSNSLRLRKPRPRLSNWKPALPSVEWSFMSLPDAKDLKAFEKSSGDVALQDGDELIIPKKSSYVMVRGQVYNPTAISYLPAGARSGI